MAAKGKQHPAWYRHFFYRKESWRTTWKLRLLLFVLVLVAVVGGRHFWERQIGESLVCDQQTPHSDALLLENFDTDYLIFERAEFLKRTGIAPRVFIPASAYDNGELSSVEKGTVELFARIAGLREYEKIPIRLTEPISLNAANQIREVLAKENIQSLIVISPGFRSRRSALVYRTVFNPIGIRVSCDPVFGSVNPRNWTDTWHGIQDVLEAFIKLQYYRFWVLQ